ncbi:MAG: PHB depolymerase family esterase [Dehalococcoidia bacterium]
MPKPFAALATVLVLLLTTACGRGDHAASPASPAPTESPTAVAASPSPAALVSPTAAPLARGVSTRTFRHGGLERSYRLYLPAAASRPGASLPLVVALHGGLGAPDQFAATSRLEMLAESEGFIAVFPAGIERTWNGGNCCRPASALRVDDTGFLAALIESLQATLPVDAKRVLVTGHSNGAIMAFRLACERPDVVDAVVAVAGSLEIDRCQPSVPVPLLDIHGDADRNHPLAGGQGDRSVANVDFRSTADTMAMWTAALGCAATPTSAAAGPLTTTSWIGCRGGVRTELVVIAGADHPWPGSVGRSAAGGEPSQALDASRAAYQFLLDVTK